MLKVGICCLVITATAGAQAIIQQGVAAASGTVAGALAGKTVSDALDSTLKATESAARTGAVKTKGAQSRHQSKGKSVSGSSPAPTTASTGGAEEPGLAEAPSVFPSVGARRGGVSRSATRSRRALRASRKHDLAPFAASGGAQTGAAQTEMFNVTPAKVTPPELTADLVKSVPVGAAKPTVISQLGKPAATIVIPDAGGLREILYYTSHGDMLAAVGVNAEGSVTEVKLRN